MKRVFLYLLLFALLLICSGLYLGICILLAFVVSPERTALDVFWLLLCTVLFLICSYLAGFLYFERRLYWELIALLGLFTPLFFLEIFAEYFLKKYYLFVRCLYEKSKGNLVSWREYADQREAEWEAFWQSRKPM